MTLKAREPDLPVLDWVRQEIPWLSDADAEDILWSRTAYPFAKSDHIKKQLRQFAVALTLGLDLCELCNSNEARGIACPSCEAALHDERTVRR